MPTSLLYNRTACEEEYRESQKRRKNVVLGIIIMTGSYVKLDPEIFYGIHPGIVYPQAQFDHYVILTTPDQTDNLILDDHWVEYASDADSSIIEHPIADRKAPPTLEEFQHLVSEVLSLQGTVYIACKGGHGRSGLVAAAVYAQKHRISYQHTLKHINTEWRTQRNMAFIRPFIRKLGSPQTAVQKKMLKRFIDSLPDE